MFTQATINALDSLFQNAIMENSSSKAARPSKLTREAIDAPRPPGERRVFVINLSSYTFRLVVIFDFPADARSLATWLELMKIENSPAAHNHLMDSFAERVNMICGAAKRVLGQRFAHVGMSTPILVDSCCISRISAIGTEVASHFEVRLEEGLSYDVVLCLTGSGKGTVNFTLPVAIGDPVAELGELELF